MFHIKGRQSFLSQMPTLPESKVSLVDNGGKQNGGGERAEECCTWPGVLRESQAPAALQWKATSMASAHQHLPGLHSFYALVVQVEIWPWMLRQMVCCAALTPCLVEVFHPVT